MNEQNNPTINVNTTRNPASLTLGIISIVLAVLALLVSWIPILGLISIPVAIIAVLLAGIGILISFTKRLNGISLPIVGFILSFLPIAVSVLMTGATSTAISDSIDAANERNLAAQAEEQELIKKLQIKDLSWRIGESFLSEKPTIEVDYTIVNTSDKTFTMIETYLIFYAADQTEIARVRQFPVGITDPNLYPGNTWVANDFEIGDWNYGNIPANQVKSVTVTVTDVSYKN